jgi:hypothetical protein
MARRLLTAAIGLGLLAAGGWRSLATPRLTLVNTGLRIDYPWPQALALLAAALGLGLLAWAVTRPWLRWTAVAAALAVATAAGARLAYRLEADRGGIQDRGLLGSTRLEWKDVQRVTPGPALLLLWGAGDTQVRIDTGGFNPEQRAMLERSIARRVREAQAAGAAVADPQAPAR